MELVLVALFWLFCGWLLWRRAVVVAMAAAIAAGPFGAFSVIPTQLTGGLTILPSSVLTALAIGQLLFSRFGRAFIAETAFAPSRLGLVTAYLAVAAFSAVFYPRIFAGLVEVVPMSGELTAHAGAWTLLAPSSQNITQLGYLALSVMGIFFFALVIQYPRYRQVILKAMVLSGTILVATGLLDFANQYVDLSFLLDPFRTADYALLVDVGAVDGKRIVGLMPEASAFGPLCVTQAVLLHVLRDACDSQRLRRWILVLVPALLVFAVLSTSSAAYLALGVTGAVLGLRAAIGLVRRRREAPRNPLPVLLLATSAVVALVAIHLVRPETLSYFEQLFDRFVAGKTETSSFDERMAWNRISLQALAETYGVGVGVGGTRASSLPVSILSNLGIPGALLLLALTATILLGRKTVRSRAEAVLCSGTLWALVPILSSNVMTGTSPNIGMGIAFVLGVHAACGVARLRAPAAAEPARVMAPAAAQHAPLRTWKATGGSARP